MMQAWGEGVPLTPAVSRLPSVVSTGVPTCTEPLPQEGLVRSSAADNSLNTAVPAERRVEAQLVYRITEMLFTRTVMWYWGCRDLGFGAKKQESESCCFSLISLVCIT